MTIKGLIIDYLVILCHLHGKQCPYIYYCFLDLFMLIDIVSCATMIDD